MQEIMQNHYRIIEAQLEEIILKTLNEKGFKFVNRNTLEHFAKTECELIIKGEITRLYANTRFILAWDSFAEVIWNNGNVKFSRNIYHQLPNES